MGPDITQGHYETGRQLALVVETVLNRAAEFEVRIEVVNVAADELTAGIGHGRRRVRRQERRGLPAVRGAQPRGVVAFQPRYDVTGKQRRVVEANSSSDHTLVVERVGESNPGPEITVIRTYQPPILALQT